MESHSRKLFITFFLVSTWQLFIKVESKNKVGFNIWKYEPPCGIIKRLASSEEISIVTLVLINIEVYKHSFAYLFIR